MSAPVDLSILDLSGNWVMNKTLSDNTEEILTLQGMGWLKRKAISIGTITVNLKHCKDDDGVEHIDIEQFITGGIPASNEMRTLDWTPRESDDKTFGPVVGKTRRVKAEELDVEFLQKGWTPDTLEQGLVHSYVESNTPKSGTSWIANQAWGFEVINGERRYTRHLKFTGPKGEDIEARLVYDYLGPLDA